MPAPDAILKLCETFAEHREHFRSGNYNEFQRRKQFLDQVYVTPEYRGKTASQEFSKVYFAPVAVGNLSRQGWWESQSAVTQRQLETDARKLAAHFRRALINAAKNDSGRLTVVNQPGPDIIAKPGTIVSQPSPITLLAY